MAFRREIDHMSFHFQNWFGGMISASADEFFWQLWMTGRTLSSKGVTARAQLQGLPVQGKTYSDPGE